MQRESKHCNYDFANKGSIALSTISLTSIQIMASGVAVNPNVITTFQSLVKERKYRAAVFKINDAMTEVQLEKTYPPGSGNAKAEWAAFAAELPKGECRYAAYDFSYQHQGTTKTRIIYMLNSPEGAKVRQKMIYASTQEGVVKKLEGVQRQMQCTDPEELEYESIAKLLIAHTAGY